MSWILSPSDGVASINLISDVLITSAVKGDILAFDGSKWVDVTVGANGQILTADSAVAAGVKWAATSAGEVNDLTAAVTWANIPAANVLVDRVTQHEAALTILESQITNGALLARLADTEIVTGAWTHTDTLVVSGVGKFLDLDGGTDLRMRTGNSSLWFNGGNTLSGEMKVVSSDLQLSNNGLTDFDIIGYTAVNIGTALTATSYDGILAANLVDKTAAETITESWIWSGSTNTITFTGGGPFGIQFRSVQSTTAQQIDLLYRTSPDTLAFERTSDAVKIIEINASTLGVDFAGAITAASYDGVLAANLLDKTAAEIISGAHVFTAADIAPAANQGKLTGQKLYLDGKEAIGGADTFLRLNNASAFTGGIFVPSSVRIDNVLRISNTAGIDFVTMSHDGIDFNFQFTNTSNVDFQGVTSLRIIAGDLRIFDSTANDSVKFSHDGIDANLVGVAGTTDLNISGMNLRVVNDVGFYNTAPVAQQTGVAVTAAAIHAALVSLGLITA